MQRLESDELIVEVADHGAELSRVYDKVKGTERLHDANPKFWNRHAPVLFPFVGACFDKKYRLNGTEYEMGQHGFARDSEFEAVMATEGTVSYVLKSNDATLAKYPFDFELKVDHVLDGRTLKVRWTVVNTGNDEMLFQIGAHPAFLIGEGKNFGNVSLDLHKGSGVKFYRIEDPGSGCCFEDKPQELVPYNGVVSLNEDFFAEGVYIFAENEIDRVTLSVDGEKSVEVVAEGFPYFGVWSKKDAPFICLEPWHGRTDAYGFKGELKDRAAVKRLGAGETFTAEYEMIFY